MGSYRRRLYKFAGKIDDDEDYDDEDIVVPEYRNVSDTTYETMRPLIQHQGASHYISNKTIEEEKDRSYAYSRPALNGFMAIRPTPAREAAAREQIKTQGLNDVYAKYRASLPQYMRTDRPGLENPSVGLLEILTIGKLFEKPLRKVAEKSFDKLIATASKTKNAIGGIGQTTGNSVIANTPRFNYNIVNFDNGEKVLYTHPRNRLNISTSVFNKIKYDEVTGNVVSVDKTTNKQINKLIKGIEKENKRAVEWNTSVHRKWENESDRIQYLKNLEHVKNKPVVVRNILDNDPDTRGLYNNINNTTFLKFNSNKEMLDTYYHEFAGHAGDIYRDSMGTKFFTKSKLLDFAYLPYAQKINRAIQSIRPNAIPLVLRGREHKLLTKNFESYLNHTLPPELNEEVAHLVTYRTTPTEVVARVEGLRRALLINKVKFNGKPFSPSTIIGKKEYAKLSNPKSSLGYYDATFTPRSLLERYDLEIFTPKTLMDLMNKLPFAAGIGTAGLAGYGLNKD
jgi:hypothetical protein